MKRMASLIFLGSLLIVSIAHAGDKDLLRRLAQGDDLRTAGWASRRT